MRRLALIYRKDKSLSKAALGFISVLLGNTETGNEAGVEAQRQEALIHR